MIVIIGNYDYYQFMGYFIGGFIDILVVCVVFQMINYFGYVCDIFYNVDFEDLQLVQVCVLFKFQLYDFDLWINVIGEYLKDSMNGINCVVIFMIGFCFGFCIVLFFVFWVQVVVLCGGLSICESLFVWLLFKGDKFWILQGVCWENLSVIVKIEKDIVLIVRFISIMGYCDGDVFFLYDQIGGGFMVNLDGGFNFFNVFFVFGEFVNLIEFVYQFSQEVWFIL